MTQRSHTPSGDERRDFFREAVNTLKASRWKLLLAKLFGRKHIGYDTQLKTRIVLIEHRGVVYLTDFQQESPNGK